MSYTDYNGDDTIDSRALAELLAEMASDRNDLEDAVNDADSPEVEATAKRELTEWDDEHGEQYEALKDFCDSAEQYCDDWTHGVQLIEDSHWTEYAEQLTDDLGALPGGIPEWVVIDWEATADNLKADYTAVEWGAYTYWVR